MSLRRSLLPSWLLAGLLLACAPKTPVESAGDRPAPGTPVPGSRGATSGEPLAGEAPAEGPVMPPAPTGPVVADTSGDLRTRMDRAADHLSSGSVEDLEKAIQLLEPAAAEDPTGGARLNLGLAYQRRGDLDRALAEYQAVLRDHPDHGGAWVGTAAVQQARGDSAGAAQSIERGLQVDPDNVDLRVAKINLLREQGRLDDAIVEAKATLVENTRSLGVYNAFALCHLEKGDLNLVRFLLDKARSNIPEAADDPFLQAVLGWTYYLEKNKPQAAFYLKKAVEVDPNFLLGLVYLSTLYMEDHNYGDTVPLMEAAIRLDPKNPDLLLTLGLAYRGVGRLDDAERVYRQALALAPQDPRPHFNLGVLIGDYRKDYDGAVREFTAYLDGGGPERELAEQYVTAIKKEQELARRQAAAEEERKKREEERKKREDLVRESEKQKPPAPEPAPGSEGGEAPPSPDGTAVPVPAPTGEAPPEVPEGAPPAEPSGESAPASPEGAPPVEEAAPAPGPAEDVPSPEGGAP